ncbi:hypothetical protein, partial [Rhodococcus aetherivorans]|uniref:hypothetical protein n=1 Tax=Rhodococcus aetherivorans TaxID=191292 RepID=UPI0031EDF9E6
PPSKGKPALARQSPRPVHQGTPTDRGTRSTTAIEPPVTPEKPQVRPIKRVTDITGKAPERHQRNIEKSSKQM